MLIVNTNLVTNNIMFIILRQTAENKKMERVAGFQFLSSIFRAVQLNIKTNKRFSLLLRRATSALAAKLSNSNTLFPLLLYPSFPFSFMSILTHFLANELKKS